MPVLPAMSPHPPLLSDAFPRGVFKSPFVPAWWLRNPHAQTVYPALFRDPPALDRERERLTLPDGDWLWLDWLLPEGWQAPRRPLTVIVHGLSGSSDSLYVLGLQQQLKAMGHGSVAVNCRGAAGGPNGVLRSYHAGSSDDLRAVLATVCERYPHQAVVLVGYSLGGNMTLKLMGELGDEAPAHMAAVAVSVPLLMPVCASRLDQGFSRVYRQRLLRELMRGWHSKLEHLRASGHHDAARLEAHLRHAPFRSFWEFDDKLMAPLHGFAGVDDYYRRCSSRHYLRDIRRTTLIIQASDDPFMSPEVLPGIAELSEWVHFELAAQGGHVGFIEGNGPRKAGFYLERRIPLFIQEWQRTLSKPETSC